MLIQQYGAGLGHGDQHVACAQLLQLAGIRDDLLRRGELYAKQIAQLMMVRLDQEWVELQHLHHQTAGCIYDHTCALALHALHDALIHIVWQRSGDAAGNHEHVLIADSVDLSKQRFQFSFIDSRSLSVDLCFFL